MGVNICFISETDNDHIGNIILQFMRDNHIPTDHVNMFPDGKSSIPLIFLNKHGNAEYIFYRDCPKQRLDILSPPINEDDITTIGSYYALDPALRNKTLEPLDTARERKAIVYYDPNFRSSHKNETMKLTLIITENLEHANIVRGSPEDFYYMYGIKDTEKVYRDKIKSYCPLFPCTAGAEKIPLRINAILEECPVTPLQTVSTTGVGDNFNADLIYGMLKYNVCYRNLQNLSEETWNKVIQYGQDFSAKVYKSFSNSVSEEFVINYR